MSCHDFRAPAHDFGMGSGPHGNVAQANLDPLARFDPRPLPSLDPEQANVQAQNQAGAGPFPERHTAADVLAGQDEWRRQNAALGGEELKPIRTVNDVWELLRVLREEWRADRSGKSLYELAGKQARCISELQRERDAALARVAELEEAVERVSKANRALSEKLDALGPTPERLAELQKAHWESRRTGIPTRLVTAADGPPRLDTERS